jgi:hypothetical protein
LVRLVTEPPPSSCAVAVELREGLRLRVERNPSTSGAAETS